MRGADALDEEDAHRQDGSSPHAWGGQDHQFYRLLLLRFIPTCVGRTVSIPGDKIIETVHPHMRGADFQCASPPSETAGSSPHAWGGPDTRPFMIGAYRFIPTCVGRTRGPCLPSESTTVHPHMRGADQCRHQCHLPVSGSSPHAWGGLHFRRPAFVRVRFIPTCVGRTSSPTRTARSPSVHPHMRGADSRRVSTNLQSDCTRGGATLRARD